MAKIKYDVSGEDGERNASGRRFDLPDVGVYAAKVVGCEAATSRAGNEQLVVTAEITKPAKNNFPQLKDYIGFQESQAWKMDQFLQAIGHITQNAKRKGEFDTDKAKGKLVQIYVTHETSTWTPDGEQEPRTTVRARISNWLKKDAKAAQAESNGDGNVDEEISLTMHGAAADEGDGESITFLTSIAEGLDIDPDSYDTWAELVVALEEADEAAEEAEEEEPEEEDATDLGTLVEQADEGDEEATEALYTYAGENESVDPDEYDTWAEWLEAEQERVSGGGESEEEEPDYESMSTVALKKLCRENELPTSGTKEELIERLQEYDSTDAFASE